MTQASANQTEESCAICQGTGQYSSGQCRACGGAGALLVLAPATKCSFCRGAGKNGNDRCWRCSGSGWAHARKKVSA